jgi:general secretion pathway protein M
MKIGSKIMGTLGRSPLIAAVLYLVVLGFFITATGLALLNITDRLRAVQEASDDLKQLLSRDGEGRTALAQAGEASADPFLEGTTLTVASAALLQRVGAAVAGVGGSVQSSQVDITTGGKDGIIGLLINCELEQSALQKLLFDIETGAPLLFVDQMDVQTAQSGPANDDRNGSLKISLNVSGRWRGAK